MEKELIPDKLIRVKRRSIALIINKNGEFVVRAPLNAKESEIWAFINEKKNWILRKKQETRSALNRNQINLENGEIVHIFGVNYTVKLIDCKIAKLKDEYVVLPIKNTKFALVSLLKRELKRYLNNRVNEIATAFNFSYKSISITSATSSWGSCGAKNSLNFTYKLALCPKPVIDYIIIHELCHTKVKNHGSKFWAEVERVYPEYKHCEKWLKANRVIINMI